MLNHCALSRTGSTAYLRHIEFVHTAQRPDDVSGELTYDPNRCLWRASVRQALRDMRATRRSMELVDEEAARELV